MNENALVSLLLREFQAREVVVSNHVAGEFEVVVELRNRGGFTFEQFRLLSETFQTRTVNATSATENGCETCGHGATTTLTFEVFNSPLVLFS